MNIYTIYLITNLINNKKYVGQTKNKPIKRFREHKGAYNDCLISKAIQKYGKENFSFEVIYQTLDVDLVDFLERHFIKEHNSFICENGHGYNLQSGGYSNKVFSKETKIKMGCRSKGRFPSIETRQKMSDSQKGNINNLGKKASDETKKKISDGGKGIQKPQQVVTCPFCSKEGALNLMKRYHFDCCKFKQ